ncbi:MAG: biopolymer transporter ExbD [Geminicoccaceae bacterium]
MADINVTPFVDVVLVLLIVFMITAPLLTVGVPIDLPRTGGSTLPGQDEPLTVSVAADGTIYVEDTATELGQIAPRLRAITNNNPDLRIFVRGDQVIQYGTVMQVIGLINAAGFTQVALVTDSETKRAVQAITAGQGDAAATGDSPQGAAEPGAGAE